MLPDMTTQQQATKKVNRQIVKGKVMLRFTGYVEVGKHKSVFQGQESIKDKVHMVFEVFGKNYPLENGQPLRVTVKENYSLHEKANFKKLFMMMRAEDKSITHMSQMLGKAFIATLDKFTMNGNDFPTLKGEQGYNVVPAVMEDPETGETKNINVPPAVGDIKKFIWNYPSKEDWDNLYIDGFYPDGNSKNVLQDLIKSATNYIDNSLLGSGIKHVEKDFSQTLEPAKKHGFQPQTVKAVESADNDTPKPVGRFARLAKQFEEKKEEVKDDRDENPENYFEGW